MTAISLGSVVLDCPDPAQLAAFYRQVLGGELRSDRPEWVNLVVDGHTLSFQKVQQYAPPSWPDGPPQQFHLDLTVEDFAGPHSLVTALGATALDPVDPPPAERTRLEGVRRPRRSPVLPVHLLIPAERTDRDAAPVS